MTKPRRRAGTAAAVVCRASRPWSIGLVAILLAGSGAATLAASATRVEAPLEALLQPREGEASLIDLTYRGTQLGTLGGDSIPLPRPPAAAYFDGLAPIATASMDGRFVASSTGTAQADLRVHVLDVRTKRDRALGPGTTSAAWRADGALAYFRFAKAGTTTAPASGEVVVREPGGSRPVVWTRRPGRSIAFGWAGRRLVVARVGEGEYTETVVVDRPGTERELADGPPIAIAPAGDLLLAYAMGDGSGRDLELIDIATGAVRHRIRTAPVSSGDWKRDRVVVAQGRRLLTLRIRNDRIVVTGTVPVGPRFALEPRFTGTSLARVVMRTQTAGASAPAVCVLHTKRCTFEPAGTPRTRHHVVYGQSVAAPTLPPPTDGRHFGYIRALSSRSGVITAVVDPARMLTGQAARRAAAADRVEMAGDYYIDNDDRSTAALRVAADARVTIVTPDAIPGTPGTLVGLLRTFADGRAGGTFRQGPGSQYWLTLRDGVVVAIAEQYLP